jgi:hypothetical protein
MLAQTGTGLGDLGMRYVVMWFGLPLIRDRRRRARVAGRSGGSAGGATRRCHRPVGCVPYLLLMWLQGPHFLGFVLMYALTGEAGGYVWAAPSIVLGVVVSLALAWKLATQRRRS